MVTFIIIDIFWIIFTSLAWIFMISGYMTKDKVKKRKHHGYSYIFALVSCVILVIQFETGYFGL